MRIELHDCNAQMYRVDSFDPRVIGDWFAEHAQLLMSANAAMMPYQISIWPSTHVEANSIGQISLEARWTQDGLLYLAEKILDASKHMGELQARL